MGAVNFVEEIKAQSAKEGFEVLVSEAISNFGAHEYNGTISTCCMAECTLRFNKYSKSNEKKAMDFIEKDDYGVKWEANYIDLGVIEYKVVTVKVSNTKDFKNPEYKIKYVVRDMQERRIGSADTKTEASNIAKRHSLRDMEGCFISKEYELVNSKQNNIIAETNIEIKTYKTEPKLKDIPGRRIVPIHKYLFYGWAAE